MALNILDLTQIRKKTITLNSVCYVDETIDDKKAKYIAFETHNLSITFKTYKELKKYYDENITNINSESIRKKALLEMKSSYLRMIGMDKEMLQSFISEEEIKKITFFESNEFITELENRKIALKELIKNTDSHTFIIDDYSNKKLKNEVTIFAKTLGKSAIFADSKSNQGIMLADIFLDLY